MRTKIKKWKTVSSRTIFQNKYFQICLDRVRLPDGRRYTYYVNNKKSRAVLVLPVDQHGRILIAREYRYPTGAVLYGAVAGSVNRGETPRQAAAREFLEETGMRARVLVSLGTFYANPGRSGTVFHPFLAYHPERVGDPHFETAEQVETEWMAEGRIDRLVAANGMMDPFFMSAYLIYKSKKHYGKIRNNR